MGDNHFTFLYCCGCAKQATPHLTYRLSSLSLLTAGVWAVRSGYAIANAEKSVRVGVLGSVWKPCWPWLHPFTSSNALWQTSHRHATIWLHRRKLVCARAALSRALRGPLHLTHTHIYAVFVAPLPRQESQISCHGSGNRQHLLGVWSQWWNCLDAEAVMPNLHAERQEMGFAVAACVSLVFLDFFFPTYFPHLLSCHTISFSVEFFARSAPKRKRCIFKAYHLIIIRFATKTSKPEEICMLIQQNP